MLVSLVVHGAASLDAAGWSDAEEAFDSTSVEDPFGGMMGSVIAAEVVDGDCG